MRKLLLAALALVLLARPARAEWYGWQILLADAASFALTFSGAEAGLASYVLVPAAVHIAHDDYGAAAASVGIRVALPIGGAYWSTHTASEEEVPGFGGLVLGAAAAMLIDMAFLSTHEECPVVSPLPGGGAMVSYAGRF